MSRLSRARHRAHDDDAELDARLARAWEDGVAAVAKMLDLPAGRQALLAGGGRGTAGAPASAAPAVADDPVPGHAAPAPPAASPWPGSRRPRQRRRLAVRALAAGGAVAALAAVTVAGVTGAFSPGQAPPVRAAAFITRVKDALSPPGENLVGYARTTLPPGTAIVPTVGGWAMTERPGKGSPLTAAALITWTYHNDMTASAFTGSGRPVFAAQVTPARHGTTTVAVNYTDSTWWRAVITLEPGFRIPRQPPCAPGASPGAGGWPAFIRGELSCGVYRAGGRQWVDGIDAIRLTGSRGLVLWISPATYLPVRQADGGQQTDFRWLRATPASLARLRVTVPAGFRAVVPPPLAGPKRAGLSETTTR